MFLSLIFHNHQPVGQLPWAFEDAWRDSYQPFLDLLERFPHLKVGLHYTGPLLDWLVEHQPATIAQIRRLVEREQVELLAGGYYEPILAVWPEADQLEQIKRLRERVEEVFGTVPGGMWLAERVWEPQLAPVIKTAGLDYTLVDSSVFQAAGILETRSYGYFEVAAKPEEPLRVLPINQPLRHLIPWKEVEQAHDYLRYVAEQGPPDAFVVFADDGEKFGAWPGTFDWVFTQGWLERFFSMLSQADWLHCIRPGDYLRSYPALGSCDLPFGSYAEMQEWSRGGWRRFLERYAESCDMYEAVSDLSERTRQALKSGQAADATRAYTHVLRAQSNDAYWHGVFGGLYLPHLRQAIYSEVAAAQILLNGKQPFARVMGTPPAEVWLENEAQRVGIRPAGGQIFAWSSQPARHNLLATLRRYPETYHVENEAIDWYGRGALLDHFFGEATTPELFATTRYPEQGDFINQPWSLQTDDVGHDTVLLTATRDGGVWVEGEFAPLSIQKSVTLQAGSGELRFAYTFTNRTGRDLNLWWGMEWNLTLSGTELPERHYHAVDHSLRSRLDKVATFETVTNPIVADNWLKLWAEWQFEEPLAMWYVPLYTTSQKEGGEIERIHQQSAFVFHRRLHLAPHAEYSFEFTTLLTAKRSL